MTLSFFFPKFQLQYYFFLYFIVIWFHSDWCLESSVVVRWVRMCMGGGEGAEIRDSSGLSSQVWRAFEWDVCTRWLKHLSALCWMYICIVVILYVFVCIAMYFKQECKNSEIRALWALPHMHNSAFGGMLITRNFTKSKVFTSVFAVWRQ